MSREWKPGEVAAVTMITKHDERRRTYSPCMWDGHNGEWVSATQGRLYPGDEWDLQVHPLVVIDPEDREQVERLLDLFFGWFPAKVKDDDKHAMADALREFANPTPPKPEEPTGLGAVVEDVDGNRWVRVNDVHWHGEASPMNRQTWGEVAAVRVLSEGVRDV